MIAIASKAQPGIYAMHRWLLRFLDTETEEAFRQSNRERMYLQAKAAIWLGTFMYPAFIVLDYFALPLDFARAAAIRAAVTVFGLGPLLTLTMARREFARKNIETMTVFACLVCQAGHVALMVTTRAAPLYETGITSILVIFVYALSRVRFSYMLLLGNLIVVSHDAAILLDPNYSFSEILTTNFVLLSLNCVGMLAGYVIEIQIRTNFVQGLKMEAALRDADTAREEASSLSAISRQINETPDMESVTERIFQHMRKTYGMEDLVLQLVDYSAGELRHEQSSSTRNLTPQQQDFARNLRVPLRPESGTLFRTYKKQKPLYLPPRPENPHYLQTTEHGPSDIDLQIAKTLDLKSFAHFPLIVQRETIGVLWASAGMRKLTTEEIRSIWSFCDQIAAAVQTSRLLRQAEDLRLVSEKATLNAQIHREEAEILADLARTANESRELERVIERVARVLQERLGADKAGLWLMDPEAKHLEFRAGFSESRLVDPSSYPQNIRSIPLRHESGGFYHTMRKQKICYFARVHPARLASSPVDRGLYDAWGFDWFVQIPLAAEGKQVGLLAFSGPPRARLTRQQLDFCKKLAGQIAGAIRTNELLRQTADARAEAEQLLANIFPGPVAEELKHTGRVEPLFYDSVTVLFTDMVGFTAVSQNMLPDELVEELDGCFSQFDAVAERNHLEKLKTIGDAYMCAGGLPRVNQTHAIDAVLAALEFQSFMKTAGEIKASLGMDFWRIRIGIHTGPVTAGVIGTRKFAYDIWGDTVNMASRMESSGEPGKVNISGETYNLVQNYFTCEYRGKIAAKGKGDVDMYFVHRIRPEFSADEAGLLPNAAFNQIRAELESTFVQ